MADTPEKEDALLSKTELSNRSVIADPLIGFLLEDRYRIIEPIGMGGWGKVYKAKHATLNMDLAVKIVHQQHLRDELGMKRFEQEALLLSRVENPHIVRIIDHGLAPAPFIVMEYIHGIQLNKWLQTNGPMPPEMAIELFLQLCDALSAAEAIRIVHRDLKPSNILIGTDTEGIQCKILDFGLAKFIDAGETERLTATGEILGSPAYMPPEQWKGQCDHRSDIYSLGCIMYEVLSGKPPFSAQFGLEYMSKHVSDTPPPFSQLHVAAKLPVGLEDIVNKCMQKSPANRYQSSLACREDLLRLKSGSKPSITLLEKIKRVRTRNLVGACIIPVLLIGAFFWNQQRMAQIAEKTQYESSGFRGQYFEKKSYSGANLPSFESCKDKLPAPVLEDDPHYVELYWKAWQLAFQHLKRPAPGSPLVSNFIDAAFGKNLYQWDTVFMMGFGRYGHRAFPFIESLDNFYARQYENGYICQAIQKSNGNDVTYEDHQNSLNPPLFAWAETEYARLSGDESRLAKVLQVLEHHAEWLENYRRKAGTIHGLYWNTRIGSGMDTTPRSGSGWVDMSTQMALTYGRIAEIESLLGKKALAEAHRKRAYEIAKAINRFMWNDKDGLYYDIDDQGKPIPCKSAACFWPMLAGISDEHQVSKLMLNLKDPKTFWRHNVFPSLAADQPEYEPGESGWQGGVMAPTNVMIVKGLDNYPAVKEQAEFTVAAVRRYLDNMYAVYKTSGTIWQDYSAESEAHANGSKPDFVGWSGLGPIQLLIEDVIGIQADGLAKTIKWRLTRSDRHGVENLQFGGITASLISARRDNLNSPAEITVTADKPFELQISGHTTKVFQVTAGKHLYRLD
jgi:serine/threonine protein kinase